MRAPHRNVSFDEEYLTIDEMGIVRLNGVFGNQFVTAENWISIFRTPQQFVFSISNLKVDIPQYIIAGIVSKKYFIKIHFPFQLILRKRTFIFDLIIPIQHIKDSLSCYQSHLQRIKFIGQHSDRPKNSAD